MLLNGVPAFADQHTARRHALEFGDGRRNQGSGMVGVALAWARA
jgi:hypothetical protein